MARLTRAISADGSVMAMAIDSTDIAARIEEIHHTSAVVTAALGRLATAASMMGVMLKGEGDSVTVRVDADGPAGVLIAVAANQAGSTDGDAIMEALHAGLDLDPEDDPFGLEGYKYAEDGQNEYGTAIIIQYMDGILNTIYPEEIAGMELAYPAKNWDER